VNYLILLSAMPSTLRLPIFALLLSTFFSFVLSAQQSASTSSGCPCIVRGTVADSVSGQPIHGALVSATGTSSTSTLTDSEGKFQFDALPSGTINLSASKPGSSAPDLFSPMPAIEFSYEVSPDAAPAILKLIPEGVIFGKVIDESGEPLEGFGISLLHRNPLGGQFFRDPRFQGTTDDEGKFRIANLPRGTYYIVVKENQSPALTAIKNSAIPQGYAPAVYPGGSDLSSAAPIKVLSGRSVQANFSLKREPFVRISGAVTGFNQQENVQVSLENFTGDRVPSQVAFNESTGAFQSGWIPPAAYTILAEANAVQTPGSPSALSVASRPVNATGDVSGIHLALQPTVNIFVEFRGDLPNPSQLAGSPPVTVALFPRDMNSSRGYRYSLMKRPSQLSSGIPSMILQSVMPGSYSVQATSLGPYYVESISWGATDLLRDDLVVSSSGAVPPIEVTIRDGVASISGSVSSGDTRTAAMVYLLSSFKHQIPKFAPADSRGNFTFSGLAPGTYRAIAVDAPASFDYENPDVLAKLSTYIQEITLVAKQSASLRLELARVGD
jgi:hypothetical protein